MSNPCTDYNILLSTFTYDEQINEIHHKILELINKKQHRNMKDNRYEWIKKKHMKNNIMNWLLYIKKCLYTMDNNTNQTYYTKRLEYVQNYYNKNKIKLL